MKREEIHIVKRRLEDYLSYKTLALEADQKALMTQVLIDDAGRPRSPVWDKVAPTQNHPELSSILNQLIDEQRSYEADAKYYHGRMRRIESYITNSYSGDIRQLMMLHYVDGISYDELEETVYISASGMIAAVTRAMQSADFADARPIL